jgi:hypothetical protein
VIQVDFHLQIIIHGNVCRERQDHTVLPVFNFCCSPLRKVNEKFPLDSQKYKHGARVAAGTQSPTKVQMF